MVPYDSMFYTRSLYGPTHSNFPLRSTYYILSSITYPSRRSYVFVPLTSRRPAYFSHNVPCRTPPHFWVLCRLTALPCICLVFGQHYILLSPVYRRLCYGQRLDRLLAMCCCSQVRINTNHDPSMEVSSSIIATR